MDRFTMDKIKIMRDDIKDKMPEDVIKFTNLLKDNTSTAAVFMVQIYEQNRDIGRDSLSSFVVSIISCMSLNMDDMISETGKFMKNIEKQVNDIDRHINVNQGNKNE